MELFLELFSTDFIICIASGIILLFIYYKLNPKKEKYFDFIEKNITKNDIELMFIKETKIKFEELKKEISSKEFENDKTIEHYIKIIDEALKLIKNNAYNENCLAYQLEDIRNQIKDYIIKKNISK